MPEEMNQLLLFIFYFYILHFICIFHFIIERNIYKICLQIIIKLVPCSKLTLFSITDVIWRFHADSNSNAFQFSITKSKERSLSSQLSLLFSSCWELKLLYDKNCEQTIKSKMSNFGEWGKAKCMGSKWTTTKRWLIQCMYCDRISCANLARMRWLEIEPINEINHRINGLIVDRFGVDF